MIAETSWYIDCWCLRYVGRRSQKGRRATVTTPEDGYSPRKLGGCLDCSHGSPNQCFGRWLLPRALFGSAPEVRNHANFLVAPFSFYAFTLARSWRKNPSPNLWRANFGGAGWGVIQTAPSRLEKKKENNCPQATTPTAGRQQVTCRGLAPLIATTPAWSESSWMLSMLELPYWRPRSFLVLFSTSLWRPLCQICSHVYQIGMAFL